MVCLPAAALERYPRFSLYNSPYPAHDAGRAIDLYPDSNDAPSPVAGTVTHVRTVRCPPKPYASDHDHLVVLDTGDHLARVLHVEPAVAVGDEVAVGDALGELVRSGFFAPWVDNHVHLGFRERDADPVRASGNLPLDVDIDVRGVPWDGTGTVAETGETYVALDAPTHPAPGTFAAVGSDDGRPLDGGIPHYRHGGALGGGDDPMTLFDTALGTPDGRDVTWAGVAVRANDRPATGLSLFCGRDGLRAKLVFADGHDLERGDDVTVTLRPTDDPVRLD
ncbi:hypothetical protein [Salarchaeum sp. JOR-1]|uniref:hypothetical protein n=1 Tax=Salarchaeum sp. JOR-1 TaxID=2599399 RepID=UPI0011988C6F|nr:hypothetical protein [Salarchaeum sp. JOR-1]QDX40058.1 hypothetical protein FQU85_03790 [Salarchaeum sp. JOR-1]